MCFKASFLFLGLIYLSSCASLRSVPREELLRLQLPGHWESSTGYFNIYCNGTFSSKLPGDELIAPSSETTSNVTRAQHVSKITKNSFVLDSFMPGSSETFHVQKWPHPAGGVWKMRAEGQEWVRTTKEEC